MDITDYKKMLKKPKHNNKKTGKYASKLEADFAGKLKLKLHSGLIVTYAEQVPFMLPGGFKHLIDFMQVEEIIAAHPSGSFTCRCRLIETKGQDLPMGRMKRKQVEDIYGVAVEVVKKG